MLETLRAYGAGLLAGTGEQEDAAAALAGYALRVAEEAAAGSQSGDGELAAARWLDAEDATMWQARAWAMEHDTPVALRLANALGWWWRLRGREAGEYPLVCQAAGRAEAGSDEWCTGEGVHSISIVHSACAPGARRVPAIAKTAGNRPLACPALLAAMRDAAGAGERSRFPGGRVPARVSSSMTCCSFAAISATPETIFGRAAGVPVDDQKGHQP
jgi:hypothetical protein